MAERFPESGDRDDAKEVVLRLESKVGRGETIGDSGSFRRQWAEAEPRICCLNLDDNQDTGGTGFLIAPDLVLTNAHVILPLLPLLPRDAGGGPNTSADLPRNRLLLRFDFRPGDDGTLKPPRSLRLAPAANLVACRLPSPGEREGRLDSPKADELDYAVLRLEERLGDEPERGYFDLATRVAEAPVAGLLTIVQHPELAALATAFDPDGSRGFNENRTRLLHRITTEAGSSGSPVFDRNWRLVALHQGGFSEKAAREGRGFNRAVPLTAIRQDLESLVRLSQATFEPGRREMPLDRSAPRLIILCGADGRGRAEALVAEAGVPPSFVALIGNRPPATISDNAIVVFIGDAAAAGDRSLLSTVRELRALHLPFIPVVENLESYSAHVPSELHPLNGVPWPPTTPLPAPLRDRIRQLLGLQVDPRDRSVFISYSRTDSSAEADLLYQELSNRHYQVFLDRNDIPPGEPVQKVIEQSIASSRSVLYLETAGAADSKWIHDELQWAYTRGLAIVRMQRDRKIDRRISLIDALPPYFWAKSGPIAEEMSALVAEIDGEIARAAAGICQLSRMVEAVADQQLGDGCTSSSPLGGNSLLVRFKRRLLDLEEMIEILIWTSPHRPSQPLVDHLRQLYRSHGVTAAILLYQASSDLAVQENDVFQRSRGADRLFGIARHKIAQDLPLLIAQLGGSRTS